MATSMLPPPSPRPTLGTKSPTVIVKPMHRLRYLVVKVECTDRNKLLFDLAYTFANFEYDVYHRTVDSDGNTAFLEFYVRHRFYKVQWEKDNIIALKHLLKVAIQSRFPKRLKMHVHLSTSSKHLIVFMQKLKESMLNIIKAKVRTCANAKNQVHTFYILAANSTVPCNTEVEAVCKRVDGGITLARECNSLSQDSGDSEAYVAVLCIPLG